jgi:chromosome partitioning protein
MSAAEQLAEISLPPIHDLIAGDARDLSAKLQAHRLKLYPPEARKVLRRFSSGEAAKLIGVNDGYLRQLSLEGKGPKPDTNTSGRRSYSLEDIHGLRSFLDETAKRREAIPPLPHRP